MKFKILNFSLISVLVLLLPRPLYAQLSKSSFIIGGALTHYDRSGKFTDITGFYKYPVDPGVELLYQYQVSNTFFIDAGINYQLGRIANWEGQVDRFRFGEVSVPLMCKLEFAQSYKKNFFGVMGFSLGKMVYVDWESPAKGNEWDNVDKGYDNHYSGKDSFVDLLFGLGLSIPTFHHNEFAAIPYLKYRVKDNWIGYARDNFFYGLKFSYQLNLKGNEEK